MSNTKSVVIGLAAAFALIAVVGGGLEAASSNAFTPRLGADFLASQGYENISGGESVPIPHNCGKNAYVREYQAEKDNKTVTQNVCFKPFSSPYLPSL